MYSESNSLAICHVTTITYHQYLTRRTKGPSRLVVIHLTISNTIPVYPSALSSGAGTSTLASSDGLAPSADQDTTHLFICREGLQRNGQAPSPRACKCGLSHRDLDLRRSAFRQNTGCVKIQ